MESNFEKMTQSELIEYVNSFDFQSNDDFNSNELVWSYNPEFLLSNLKINNFSIDDWIYWINNEQEMFNKESDYDRYKNIEEDWIPNPSVEPIILIQRPDGTHDISDGCHRTGLAFRNKLEAIPVMLGVKFD